MEIHAVFSNSFLCRIDQCSQPAEPELVLPGQALGPSSRPLVQVIENPQDGPSEGPNVLSISGGLIRTRLGRLGQLGRIRCLQKLQEQSVCRWFHAKDICFQSDVPSQKQLGCSRILDQHAFDKELPRTLSHTHILFTHCHTLTYCSHTLTYSHTVRTLSHTHILFAHCHILTYCTF